MNRANLTGRLNKLENDQPPQSYNGAMKFIWDGPGDDAALAEAEAQAEAENKLLIVRTIVSPPAWPQ
jgi:hypothetical protein